MRSRTCALSTPTDRRRQPRRLVQRQAQCVLNILTAIKNPPARFRSGDMLRFVAADGQNHFLTILAIEEGLAYSAVWNGQPHFVCITIEEIEALRVLEIDRMPLEDVVTYLRWLGLDQFLPTANEVAA